jgi:hypothetical protein
LWNNLGISRVSSSFDEPLCQYTIVDSHAKKSRVFRNADDDDEKFLVTEADPGFGMYKARIAMCRGSSGSHESALDAELSSSTLPFSGRRVILDRHFGGRRGLGATDSSLLFLGQKAA